MANASQREDFLLYKRYIEAKGGSQVQLDPTYNHPRLYFTYKGVRRFVITSKTPSDWRTAENTKRTINQLFAEIERSTPEQLADDAIEDARAADRADARFNPMPKLHVPKTFGGRLQYAREQSQLTREELARISGISEDQISVYEVSEATDGNVDHALKLSTALKTTLKYLVGEEDGEKTMSDIGRRVSAKRQEHNLTIGMLAEQTGIPVTQLTNLETGIYPNFTHLSELAKALSTTEEYLRTGVGEETIWSDELKSINNPEALGAFMRVLRVKMNISQMQLAEKVGEKWPTEISKMERGLNTRWIIKQFVPLANALNFHPADLKSVAERVLVNEGKAKAAAKVADAEAEAEARLRRTVPPAVTPPAPAAAPVAASTPAPMLSGVLEAIREEGKLTREALARQHVELMTALTANKTELLLAIRLGQSSTTAEAMHAMIDQMFKK